MAKHTDIDGISDVDALVILIAKILQEKSSQDLLDKFYEMLDQNLPRNEVAMIDKGRLAVTMKYHDNLRDPTPSGSALKGNNLDCFFRW